MKRVYLIFILALGFGTQVFGQNSAPVISNVVVNHSPGTQTVTIGFDLADAENDPVEMHLRVSGDNGRTWIINLQNPPSGDLGFPVAPGTGKSITWNYSLSSLAADGLVGNSVLTFRLVADDRFPVDIQEIVDQVDSTSLVETLRFVEGIRHRSTGLAHLDEVRDSIQNLMAASGLQDWHQAWSFFSSPSKNFIGRMAGLTSEKRTWFISGHYDSVSNSPGADDNGTATAGVMEAVRLLSGYSFRNSIRFCAFDLEEEGTVGSIWYNNQNQIPSWEDVAGVLNMEMIGYYDNAPNSQSLPFGFDVLFPDAYNAVVADSFRGNFLTNVANVASDSLRLAFDSCAAQYVPDLKVISIAAPGNSLIAPDLRRSDHAPFWDRGHRALMLTDAADQRNYNYHSPADSVGTLDLGFFLKNVKAVIATLVKLAGPIHAGTAMDTFQVDVPVGVSPSGHAADLQVYPNPSTDAFHIDFTLDHPQEVKVRILDQQGRMVRSLAGGSLDGGGHQLIWDGNGAKGSPVAAGTYWVELLRENGRSVRAIRLLR